MAMMPSTISPSGGEGCLNQSWIQTEADFNADALSRLMQAKFHDKALQMGFGPENTSKFPRAHGRVWKRSYKRARNRAVQHGCTWYRGRYMTADQFAPGVPAAPLLPRRSSHRPVPQKQPTPRYRLQVGHVNVGGLALEKLHEVKIWAQNTNLDVLLLSETRWSYTNEWEDAQWYHLHTGTDTDRADGLLFLVRKTLCSSDQLGFVAPLPGRLGHLRLHFQRRALDILGCYQFADTQVHHKSQHRQLFWTKLDEHMSMIPNRNNVIILGDFNCSATAHHPYVGTDMHTWKGKLRRSPPHRDGPALLEFLQKYHLTILNSWNAKNPPTYDNQISASSIDHVIMRIADADASAKDVKHVAMAPFVPLTGARHIPLVCSVRKIPYAYTRTAHNNACTYQQRLTCRRAWQMQDDQWHQFHHEFTTCFHDFTQQEHDDITLIDDMHAFLYPVFTSSFPKERKTQLPSSAPNAGQTHVIKSQWQHRAFIFSCQDTNLRTLFQVWFHYGRYRALKRLHQRITRQLKKQKLQDLLAEVAHASIRHDSFAVYQTIRKYTPRQPLKRIRLRLPDGTPANHAQVMQMTKDYITEVWRTTDSIALRQPAPTGVPFSVEDLELEIANIPMTKAVARCCLPGICWKVHAKQVAEFFHAKLLQWWSHHPVYIPQQWKDAHLTFINKPAKSPDKLENLRPLALLEPVGKSVLGLLTSMFAAEIQPLISPWPQLAFMRHRSTLDAIRRVTQHCHEVRILTSSQRRSVHARAMQEPCFKVCGGIQVLLDANKAFDMVPRPSLFEFLNTLPINQMLVTLLSEWHTHTAYVVSAGGVQQRVETGRGVRQGCRAAPLLWCSHTLHLFYQLRAQLDENWIRTCLTAFADDFHCCAIFRSEQQLEHAIRRIGILLDLLESLGVQLSLDKSHVIIKIGGTNCRLVQKKYILVDSHGPHILIPRTQGGTYRLPVRTQAKYLGIMVSYGMFERQTTQLRIKAARHTFARLYRWIRAKQIPKTTRLQIWHSCVLSTMVYGLFATGFTQSDLHLLQQCIFTMYRRLLGDHSFHTHHTHAEVLRLHSVDHPLSLLLHAGRQLQETLSHRLNHLDSADIVWTIDWTHLATLITMIQCTWQEQLQATETLTATEAQTRPFSCSFCTFTCGSLPNLRRHMTNTHGHTQLRTHFTTVASFAVRGLPQCNHCLEMFPSWRNFQIHLERNCCQALTSVLHSHRNRTYRMTSESDHPKLTAASLTLLLSKPYGLNALQCVKERNWNALLQLPAALADWTHHCSLCGVFCNRPQDMNLHLRTQHPLLLPHVLCKASQLGRAQASNSPCRFCHKTFRRVHQCPIMVQAALLLVNTDDSGQSFFSPGDAVLRCDICAEQFQEIMQLHCHLYEQHRLEPLDWEPLRDMLAGTEPVCAHCTAIFTEKSALRQHITQGQCMQFNPVRQPAEIPVHGDWQEIIRSGDIAQLHQAPQKRMHLTLRCQFCQIAFQRTGDLSLHLQTVHSLLWNEAKSHVQMLVEASSYIGCLCNPKTNASGLQHICVAYRQIGMMVQKMNQPMFLPWTFERTQIRQFLHAITKEAIGNHICETVHNRLFSDLWTNPLFVQFFRTRCMLCGLQFHPAELMNHARTAHPSDMRVSRTLMLQLLPALRRENPADHQCEICQQIFNLPVNGHETQQEMADRSVLAQIHLQHQCPVLFQLLLLLQNHGVRSTLHTGRLGNVGDIPTNEPTPEAGEVRTARRRQRSQEDQTGAPPARRTCRRRRQDPSGDGPTPSQGGRRAAGAEATRLMDMLHANRVTSIATSASQEGHRVEATTEDETGEPGPADHAAAMPAHTASGRDPALSGHQAGTMFQRGSTEEDSHGTGPSDPGRSLSVPTLEPSSAEPQDHTAGAHFPAQDGEVRRTAHGHTEGPERHCEVSQLASHDDRGSGTMDVADLNEVRRSPDPAQHPARKYSMGTAGPIHEASYTPPEQAGTAPAIPAGEGHRQDSVEREGEAPGQDRPEASLADENTVATPDRATLMQGLSTIRLANDANWCYVNAAILSTLWAFLSVSSFDIAQWGRHSARIVQMLTQHHNTPVELSNVDFLQPLFLQWQNLGHQGDPVEFLAHVMRGLHFTGINLSWEKRVQIGLLTEVVDESDAFTPLILRFDPAMLQDDVLTLHQMIRDWSNQDGMVTALTTHTPLVCVQLDRLIRSGTGQIAKCDIPVNFHWGIDLPVYMDDGMTIQWKTYRVIAAIAHLGHDTAGHCRSLLRVEMNDTAREPHMFLLTEDWLRAVTVWKEPQWFLRNITCFWLGDWDLVDLHRLPASFDSTCKPPEPAKPVVHASDLLSHFADGTDQLED